MSAPSSCLWTCTGGQSPRQCPHCTNQSPAGHWTPSKHLNNSLFQQASHCQPHVGEVQAPMTNETLTGFNTIKPPVASSCQFHDTLPYSSVFRVPSLSEATELLPSGLTAQRGPESMLYMQLFPVFVRMLVQLNGIKYYSPKHCMIKISLGNATVSELKEPIQYTG